MTLNVFFCSAQEDKALTNKLKKHLEPMERAEIITLWREVDIQPGQEVDTKIREQLDIADIILLLVSPDFPSSQYYGADLNEIIKQHKKKSMVLVILRPCDWKTMFPSDVLEKLKILPSDKRPITQVRNRDQAWFGVVRDIHQVIESLYPHVKTDVPILPASDTRSLKAIQKILSLCYRRAIFTPFDEEINAPAMFTSLTNCRIALQKNIVSISFKETQMVVSEIIGELDLIERLEGQIFIRKLNVEDRVARTRAINYAKLRIIKGLSLLARTIHAPFVLPKSFIHSSLWEEGDIDKALEGVMYPRHEQLLQAWTTEKDES